jgi:putative excisionase DUF1233
MSETTQLAPARYVTVELAAKTHGLSPGAIRKRIERGQWIEGREWRRGPDGRVWIDTKGVERWVEQAPC